MPEIFFAERVDLCDELREYSCGLVERAKFDEHRREDGEKPWSLDVLGRASVERETGVRLGVSDRASCDVQLCTPQRRAREGESAAGTTSTDSDVLDVLRGRRERIAEQERVQGLSGR